MPVDLAAAERFVLANARLLDRHRLAVLLHGAPTALAHAALLAYRNPDGGFGHALEPDVRAPSSEPASTLAALEVLRELGVEDRDTIAGVTRWVAGVAEPDGGVPFVLPAAAAFPRAPWMQPASGGSHLTFALAAALLRAGVDPAEAWLDRATRWCWRCLEGLDGLSGYWVKFALDFLDAVPDEARATDVLDALGAALDDDGSLPVPGGAANERLTPLALSARPGARSRVLFTLEQVAGDLDALEAGQQPDGGWSFDWLAWSPGQELEWRGAVTIRALVTLALNGRVVVRAGPDGP